MTGENRKNIWAIVGSTASGKTEIAVALAHYLGKAEIINCDSVQIYREIEIATAKPSPAEKRGVPHHLFDYVAPHVKYTAANWARDAAEKITEIERRGNTPILVGGTGFYLRALREPLFDSPPTDNVWRERLTQTRLKKGAEHLHKILSRIDCTAAEKLFPRDYVRTTRALEYFFQTGELFSRARLNRSAPPEFSSRIKVFALAPPRDALYERINRRAARHFENGLVEEVKALRDKGLRDDTNALGAHGYRRVTEFLRGERTLESAVEQTAQDVRNYAKRQISWFKREKDVIWIEGFGEQAATQQKLFELIQKIEENPLHGAV